MVMPGTNILLHSRILIKLVEVSYYNSYNSCIQMNTQTFFFHTKYSPKRNDVTFEKITYPN